MELENKIKTIAKYKLRDFIVKMAGGATPKKTEYDKYYCSDDSGMPFIRVQNLSPEGLQLEDCKYINEETHSGLLGRSKVFEDNLLVKITGVGRMAVSSVAPKGFEGNINQHMVVIKTKNLITSQLIANFLNSDIGEKLATRRSTGGTRPALDYTALRSIPIILNEQAIIIMDNAYIIKQEKEKQANELLDSINDYLLDELNIVMPKVEKNTLENRMSYVASTDVIGGRFDPKKYTAKYINIFHAIKSSKYDKKTLRQVIKNDITGSWGLDETVEDESFVKCLTIRATEFDNRYNLKLDNNRVKYRKYTPRTYERMSITIGDILVEKSGGSEDQPVGRVAIIDKESVKNNTLAFSNFIHKIVANDELVYSDYLYEYLTLMHNIRVTEVMQNQTNGIRNLIMGEYFGQTILLPDKNKQKEIALHIQQIRETAKQLEEEATNNLTNAKLQVEKILLGEI